MARRNRVSPAGELLAVPDRGMFWGNRGSLLDRHGELTRAWRTRAWLICVLEFKGRHRQVWTPGHLTELFFLDEATGLAAGHRPCGECRGAEYREFRSLWAAMQPDEPARAPAIDARLHADRLAAPATATAAAQRTHAARLAALPDGALVALDGASWLVWGSRLLRWTPGGYRDTLARRAAPERVTVRTPRTTVAILAAGYRPVVHPSALR